MPEEDNARLAVGRVRLRGGSSQSQRRFGIPAQTDSPYLLEQANLARTVPRSRPDSLPAWLLREQATALATGAGRHLPPEQEGPGRSSSPCRKFREHNKEMQAGSPTRSCMAMRPPGSDGRHSRSLLRLQPRRNRHNYLVCTGKPTGPSRRRSYAWNCTRRRGSTH